MQGSIFDEANCGGRMNRPVYVAALFGACIGSILLAGCGGGAGSSATIEIIPPSTGASVDVGSAQPLNFTASVSSDTKNQGVKWTLTGSSSTCSGDGTPKNPGCGILSNQTPFSVSYTAPTALPSSSALSVTLTATSVAQTSITSTITITIQPSPAFSTAICNPAGVTNPCGLPAGANGVAYNQAIQITGGVAPYTFAISGALPDCLSFNLGPTTSLTTSIVGKPCSSGSFSFTVKVTDSGGAASVTQSYAITISAAPPLSFVTTSLPGATLNVAYNQTISVTGGVAPLTWSIVSGGLPPGLSLSPAAGRITGIPTVQPVSYPATYSFTVRVQDSALLPPDSHHQTATQPLSITVQQPSPLSITTPAGSLTGGTTGSSYNVSLQATGGVQPYTWTVTQGQLPSGLTLATLSDGTGSISGTPVLTGTSTFTVELTDSVGSTPQTRSFSIAIAAGTSNNPLLSGQYSFLFNGFDAGGAVMIAGTITADGAGNITAGTQDSNRNSGIVTGASLSGCYAIGSDGRGTLEVTSTFGPNNNSLTADYSLALESDGSIRFIQYHPSPAPPPCSNAPAGATADTATHGEGVLKPVLATAFGAGSFNGHYAFEFPGQDLSGKPAALAGVIHADGTMTLDAGTCDFNDAGTYGSQSLSGSFTFSANNIGTASMTFVVPTKSQITLNFVYFFVSPSDLYFIETDSSSTTGKPSNYRLSGEMIQQPAAAATFGQASLAGASVATGTGVDGSNASVLVGLLSAPLCDGATPATLGYDENDGGTIGASSFSGTCTVSSNGRASFTGFGSSPSQARVAVAYLTGPGQGFLLGSDAAVTTGLLEQQISGPSFSDSSVQGGYTLSAPFAPENQVTNSVGQVDADGSGNLAGTVDESDPSGTPHLNQSFSATASTPASNGRGTMTTNAPVGVATDLIFYIVSSGSLRAISADAGSQHPQVIFIDH
jgi:Putative Ig domain